MNAARGQAAVPASTPGELGYVGTDNLEIMTQAVNYNRFLVNEVLSHRENAATVLDFGAGIGTFAEAVRDNTEADITCVELEPVHLARLQAAGFKAVAGLDPVPDGTIDYVYTLNVLEHIEDDVEALRQIRRVLRPDGRLYIYVPASQLLYSMHDKRIGHCRRYGLAQLRSRLIAAGFRVESIRYCDSLGFFAALLFKYVGSSTGEINPTAVRIFDRWIFPLSRILDRLTFPLFGKNLAATARPNPRA
jgi:SAM-dependent methyltransferase